MDGGAHALVPIADVRDASAIEDTSASVQSEKLIRNVVGTSESKISSLRLIELLMDWDTI